MKNKILILSSVLCLGIVASYVAFGWSEPTGSMPSEYKAPINTSIETQDVAEGKPVVTNLNSDQVDGYEASDLLAATSSGGDSTLNLIVAQYTKNNPGLDFPGCPTGFVPLLKDGFVQYQNQENVLGGYYDTNYLYYRPRISLNGADVLIFFQTGKNTQTSCLVWGGQYISLASNEYFRFPVTCVGDCSCSDAASIAVTYTICSRNPLSSTIQGGDVAAPEISVFTVDRLISDIPYKGKLQILANIDNGGENVEAKLYVDNVLIETKTVTSNYSYIIEVSESTTHSAKLQISNSVGSDEATASTWVGAIGGGMYTEADCTNAGGEVVSIQPGQRTCRFTQNSWSCPPGWTGYYNWSKVLASGFRDYDDGSPYCYQGPVYNYPVAPWDWSNTLLAIPPYDMICSVVQQRGCY